MSPNFFFTKNNTKCLFFYFLLKKSKTINVGINNGLDSASEPGAGTPNHAVVHSVEYLSVGSHQAGLDTVGISIGMYLNSPQTN